MTAKTLDEIIRRVLNDSDIFHIEYSIFDTDEWKDLCKQFQEGNFHQLTSIIDEKIQYLQISFSSERNRKNKKTLEKAIKLAKSLKKAVDRKSPIVNQMFSTLDCFGLVKCYLPNMEDYGKVIENHNRSTVEQFFFYKIKKENYKNRRKALKKTFEYLKELYMMNLNILEIAFFIRKLDSLTYFIEVIKDE